MLPNRMIKDSIRTSKSVNAMTDFQFRIWVYLITYVDDYGRGSADPELLKSFLFPRRKRVSEADISKSLADLAGMGCILLYEVDGESYLCFPKWGDHQRIQQKHSKFPEPPETEFHNMLPCVTVSNGESPLEAKANTKYPPIVPPCVGESAPDDHFDEFWASYPRKDAKQPAARAWKKLKADKDENLRTAILAGVERAKAARQWQEDGGKYIPYASTFLNQRRWEDESESPPDEGPDDSAPPYWRPITEA